MQVLQPEQLWATPCRNSRQFSLTGCTRGSEISFTVANTKYGSQVKLCCSLEDSGGVSGIRSNQIKIHYLCTIVKSSNHADLIVSTRWLKSLPLLPSQDKFAWYVECPLIKSTFPPTQLRWMSLIRVRPNTCQADKRPTNGWQTTN